MFYPKIFTTKREITKTVIFLTDKLPGCYAVLLSNTKLLDFKLKNYDV